VRRATTIAAVLGAAALPLATVAADEAHDRISATVRGHAVAAADELSIELTVSESAESAEEAERRYRETLSHVLAALGKGDPKLVSETKRRPKKRASDEDAPKPKRAPNPDDDDDEAPPPRKKPAKKKKADETDDGDEAPAKKPKKAEDKKAEDEAPEKKDDGKKDDAKKDETPIAFDVREGSVSIGVRTPDPNQARMRRMGVNQPGPKEEPQVRFSSTITIALKEISKFDSKVVRKQFAMLVDKAVLQGAELGFGSEGDSTPAVIKFSIKDPYNFQPTQLLQGEDVVMDVAVDVDLYVEFELK
jgi:hypothetical protein